MKRTYFILVLLSTLLLSSCFELIEDITIAENGSGHIKLILNASQSKSDINALLLLKEVNGYKIPTVEKVQAKIKMFRDSIENTVGFSNVVANFDDQNFILIFEADFDKVERLNDGIYKLWQKSDPYNAKREHYFKYNEKQFIRSPGQLFTILYQKMKAADRKVLSDATYTALYRFHFDVVLQKNNAAKISPNKKVVFLKLPLQLMVEKPSYWYNIITHK